MGPVREQLDLRGSPGYVLLCLKKDTEPASKMLCFKKLDDAWPGGNKIVSVNGCHTVFSCLSAHDNFAMQALVWLGMVQPRATQLVFYTQILDNLTQLSTKFKGKT